MSLPKIPGDAELCDMIRAGLTTCSALARKIYGYPDEMTFRSLRGRIHKKLTVMEKYGIVRKNLTVTPFSRGQYVCIWEVIE